MTKPPYPLGANPPPAPPRFEHQAGQVLGAPHPDWPEDLTSFAERAAYQRGVADARHADAPRLQAVKSVLMRMRDRWWPFVHEATGASRTARALLKESADVLNGEALAPVDMILYCPNCGEQHIDAPDPSPQFAPTDDVWTNPPHRSHLCHECGCVWRPADVPTNGVASIQTEGKTDTWPAYAGEVIAAQALTPGEYRTAAGHAFIFDGWPAGESPLELFDASKWLECLHACMFAASRRVLLEDDQVLHELVHLALGIDICTHNTIAGLREAVKGLT